MRSVTQPVIGRICIGKLVQKEGKWVPEKDDSFTLTTQVQQKGKWLLHPLHQQHLSKHASQGKRQDSSKIRAIPVQVLFNDSDLNLRAEYNAFDQQIGRSLCVGDGEGETGQPTDRLVSWARAFGGHSMPHQKLIAGEQSGTDLITNIVTDDDLLTIAQEIARSKLAKGVAITDKQLVTQSLRCAFSGAWLTTSISSG